eukprot:TRINITY_DN4220_c0_g4_i1.p1 TRINITY_DN4220_c0_g4~~TRINITY_DN4220_c0_g4_i1.p1  ORF type:complete len:1658 (+),score=475.71 TRINITY_DN4220_c0_g4_i1:109-4974(+)
MSGLGHSAKLSATQKTQQTDKVSETFTELAASPRSSSGDGAEEDSPRAATGREPHCLKRHLSIFTAVTTLCLTSIVLCASLSTWLAVDSGDRALASVRSACDDGLLSNGNQARLSVLLLASRVLEALAQTSTAFISSSVSAAQTATREWSAHMRAIPPERLNWALFESLMSDLWATMHANRHRFTGVGIITHTNITLIFLEDDITVGSADYSTLLTLQNNGSEYGPAHERTVVSWAQPWAGNVVGTKLPGQPQAPSGLQAVTTTNITEARCGCYQYGPDQSQHPDWCGDCTFWHKGQGLCRPRTFGWCPEPICLSRHPAEPGGTYTHNTSFIQGWCPRPLWPPMGMNMWWAGRFIPPNRALWSPLESVGPYVGLMTISTFLHPSATANSSWYRMELGGPRTGITFVGMDTRRISTFLAEELWADADIGRARVIVVVRSDLYLGRRNEGNIVGTSHGQPGKAGVPLEQSNETQLLPRHVNDSEDIVIRSAASYIYSFRDGNISGWDGVYQKTKAQAALPLSFPAVYSNGTQEEFLLKLRRLQDDEGLDLWLALMLDYEFVLGEITREAAAVVASIDAARSQVEDDLRGDRTILYIIVSAVALALIALAVLLVFAIVRPLKYLAQDMAQVAALDLEDLDQEESHIAEVKRLQCSFWKMVRFLREWKAFVPTDALMGIDDEDDCMMPGANLGGEDETSSIESERRPSWVDSGKADGATRRATVPRIDTIRTQRSGSASHARRADSNLSAASRKRGALVSPTSPHSGGSPRFWSSNPSSFRRGSRDRDTRRGSGNTRRNSGRTMRSSGGGPGLMSRLKDTGTLRFRRGSMLLAETYAALHCDARVFEHAQSGQSASSELSSRMALILTPVLDATARGGGTVVLITAERCLVSWNIFKSCHDYAAASCRTALEMAQKAAEAVGQSGLAQEEAARRWWSLCISGGGAFVGNIGNDGRRAPIVVSSCIALIHALSRLACRIGAHTLVADKLYRQVSTSLEARPVDVVPELPCPDSVLREGDSRGTTTVYELMDPDPLGPDGKQRYAAAFSAMCAGNWARSREEFGAVLQGRQDHHSLRLFRIVLAMERSGAPAERYRRSWRLPWEDHEASSARVELPAELTAEECAAALLTVNDGWAQSLRVPLRRQDSITEAQLLQQQIVQATETCRSRRGPRRGRGAMTGTPTESAAAEESLMRRRLSPPGTPAGERSPDAPDSSNSSARRMRGGGLRPGRAASRGAHSRGSSLSGPSHARQLSGGMTESPGCQLVSAERTASSSSSCVSPRHRGLRPGRAPQPQGSDGDSSSESSTGSSSSSSESGGLLSGTLSSSPSPQHGVAREFRTGRGDREQTWYRGERCLGKGAFGEVWLAMGEAGQLVALKALPLPSPPKRRQRRGLRDCQKHIPPEEVGALVQEVDLMTKLRHDNIVWYLGSGVVGRCIVIVMEYLPGGSLMGLVGEFGAIKIGPARRYIADMLDGLAFLHQQGIVHRDLKPANVLLTIEGQCKLADFGASGELASKSVIGGIAGTPLYMAPEAVRQAGKPSDMWSLGITVIQILTGRLPYDIPEGGFNAMGFMRRLERGEVVPKLPPTLQPAVAALVRGCLCHEAGARPTADELLQHEFLVQSPASG